MKNASGLKRQMLPSSLSLLASFFKALPLPIPQTFNRFQLPHPCFEHLAIIVFIQLYCNYFS